MFDSVFKPRPHRILSSLCYSDKGGDGALHVLQIGANDGLIADPVTPLLEKCPYLCATRVEPIPEYYQKLLRVCQSSAYSKRVKCINAAICDHDGSVEMIMPPGSQAWESSTQGLARLKGVAVDTGRDESQWRSVSVASMTPSKLLESSLSSRVDVYVSDCEGYDIDLLALMPLRDMKVRIIYIELISSAFSSSSVAGDKLGKLWQLLGSAGFNSSVWDGFNLIAWMSPPSWSSRRPRLLPRNLF